MVWMVFAGLIAWSSGALAQEKNLEQRVRLLEERLGRDAVSQSDGPSSKLDYRGHFQFRSESARNQKGVQGANQAGESFYRLRAYFAFEANSKLDFNLAPQATKGVGAEQADIGVTSGSTNHEELTFFEANIRYALSDRLDAVLGRQEIAYGDHLIIGSLPWANPGRSFDGLRFRRQTSNGSIELLQSKITDNQTSADQGDDVNLTSLYGAFEFGPRLGELDLYFIRQSDSRQNMADVNTFGVRALGKSFGNFFYRTENGIQSGAGLGEDAYQYNLELGVRLSGVALSVEGAIAGADYRQLYPTAHKFLGIADLFGRRNIEQYVFRARSGLLENVDLTAEFHRFYRKDGNRPAYKLDGSTPWGSAGDSEDIGSELDLVATVKTRDSINLQLGAAWFDPGRYMKDQSGGEGEATEFYYAQVNAGF